MKAVEQARVLARGTIDSASDLLLVLLLKFIDNHFAIAIVRIICIYLHFITVYISLYLFTYLFSTALVNLQTGYIRGLGSYSLILQVNRLISDRLTLEVKTEVQEIKEYKK